MRYKFVSSANINEWEINDIFKLKFGRNNLPQSRCAGNVVVTQRKFRSYFGQMSRINALPENDLFP